MQSRDIYPKIFEVKYGPILSFERFDIEFKDGKFTAPFNMQKEIRGYENGDISPSESDWRLFWDRMDEINLWDWNNFYEPQNVYVLDGVSWMIKISVGNKKIECHGSNAYPGDNPDEIVDLNVSTTFRKFLNAVEDLTGLRVKIEDDSGIESEDTGFDIRIGDILSKEEIEIKFDTNFGNRIRGINLRRWEDGTPYIIIFSRSDGPYFDKFEDGLLYYDGEGQGKDQKLTTNNKALIESNTKGKTIFGFRQKEVGKWEYLGVLEVLDYNYFEKHGFMTYEFKLKLIGVDIPDFISSESKEIMELVKYKPRLKDEVKYDNVNRKRRNDSFRKIVKKAYGYSCAICDKKRYNLGGYPEVEAAHIYPKSKDGSDDPRNGIALCKLHHWAFDNGLMSIKDNFSILVNDQIKNDMNYEEIYRFENKLLKLPEDTDLKPSDIYLSEHRKLHGF